jgi:hypothetical protein
MSEFLSNVTGKIDKIIFIACKSDFTENTDIGVFELQYNPASISTGFSVVREDSTKATGADNESKFKILALPDISIDFTLDATGASSSLIEGFEKIDIAEKIEQFSRVCFIINGDIHETNYVKIKYGKFLFKCVFVSCDIQYTLFKSDGTPLRAVVKSKFKSHMSDTDFRKMIGLESPDVTHRRTLKDSDRLISMSNSIYNRNDLYQEVARFNELNSFRKIPTGTELYFPSIEK